MQTRDHPVFQSIQTAVLLFHGRINSARQLYISWRTVMMGSICHRRRRLALVVVTLGIAVCALKVQAETPTIPTDLEQYQIGHGYSLPAYHLTLGGYASLQAQDFEDHPLKASIQDLSLFLNWTPGVRWQIFSEVNLTDTLGYEGGDFTTRNAEFNLERLYVDYAATDTVALRIGKFLTPVGRWNQLHAAPLEWTVSRPLITEELYAHKLTGLMIHGTKLISGNEFDYSLFGDDSLNLDPDQVDTEDTGPNILPSRNFNNAFGITLRYHLWNDLFQVGVSYLNSLVDGLSGRKHLFDSDLLWIYHDVELSGEMSYRISTNGLQKDEWGGFLQGVVPLYGHIYGVARGEIFDSAEVDHIARIVSLGIAYRPQPALIYKLEYRLGNSTERLAPEGWLASIAILF